MSGSWFESGYEGVEREQEKRDVGGMPKRWWMSAGTTKDGVFIDDSPFSFDEHQWKTAESKFPLFGTCLAKISQEGCPLDGARGVQRADYVGHLTIIDITGYTTRDGKEVKFELIEFCPKLKVMNKLKMKKQAKGSLIAQLCKISRTDENAPNTGDDFEFVREVKMDELYKVVTYRGKNISEMIGIANGKGENALKMRKYLANHFQIPADGDIPNAVPVFNYAKIHAPLPAAELRRMAAGAVGYDNNNRNGGSGGGSGASGSGTPDDTVPF